MKEAREMGNAAQDDACPFCRPGELEFVLTKTEHFYLLVDNAPLTEGHLLIVPHDHWPCYGSVPAEYDDELAELKARVSAFLEHTYRSVCFFEHGVFRQTVYHAHLHAMPLGADALSNTLADEARRFGGAMIQRHADVRTWYAATGQYFYVEASPTQVAPGVAALFPAEEAIYFRVLASLVSAAGRHQPYQSQAARRLSGGARMRAVADAWEQYSRPR